MSDNEIPTAVTVVEPPAAVVTVADYRAEQAAEYGTYVAATAIDINGARAFNAGDPVPASHVDSGVLDTGQVHKITTKAGRVAAGLEKG